MKLFLASGNAHKAAELTAFARSATDPVVAAIEVMSDVSSAWTVTAPAVTPAQVAAQRGK
jgi:hypothetical protein